MHRILLAGLLSVFFLAPVHAGPEHDRIREVLAKTLPGVQIKEVRSTPIAGVFEVVSGTRVAYVSADGKYLLSGEIIDLSSQTNLTAARRGMLMLAGIDALGEANMLVIGPKNAKRTVTVFTDVDCTYCARFHLEVPELNRQGVRVRYLFFPRSGIGSESYKRAVAVWCAKDRAAAITTAKAGGKIDMKTCANPVSDHYQLGNDVGVQGTPTLILDNGQMVPGYVPAAKLVTMWKQD